MPITETKMRSKKRNLDNSIKGDSETASSYKKIRDGQRIAGTIKTGTHSDNDASHPLTNIDSSNVDHSVPAIGSTGSGDIMSAYDVTTMSIISSSHIQQKVARALETLSTFPIIPSTRPKVVVFHSKAAVATKLITIVEIAKRDIAKHGDKWFQYNKIEQVVVEHSEITNKAEANVVKTRTDTNKFVSHAEEGGSASEEEAAAFEAMKTPFERANEEIPKVRAVPIMTIYLARGQIDSLRKSYG
jgi:hypothetical protein